MSKLNRKSKLNSLLMKTGSLPDSWQRPRDYPRACTCYVQGQLPGPKNWLPPEFTTIPGRLRLLAKFSSVSLGPCSHLLPFSSNKALCQTCPELYQWYLESWHSYLRHWVPYPTPCLLRLCHLVGANWGGYGTRQPLARPVAA